MEAAELAQQGVHGGSQKRGCWGGACAGLTWRPKAWMLRLPSTRWPSCHLRTLVCCTGRAAARRSSRPQVAMTRSLTIIARRWGPESALPGRLHRPVAGVVTAGQATDALAALEQVAAQAQGDPALATPSWEWPTDMKEGAKAEEAFRLALSKKPDMYPTRMELALALADARPTEGRRPRSLDELARARPELPWSR